MQQPSDEIKSRIDIVDLLREYIPLKPAGINFRAQCPFHSEKTPSFIVSPEKQIWHCFGCGKGGDIFSFIMEMEGISFVEALRALAPKAGVTLKQQNPKILSQRNRLLDILDFSRRYYYKVLIDSPLAKEAREYIKQRGLKNETIDEWQIGYSPDSWDDLFNKLRAEGYKDNEIFLAGMVIKKEAYNNQTNNNYSNKAPDRFYNRFRNRIMFPINDVNSNTVAFSARISPGAEKKDPYAAKMGKYINSPQTMIYDKSKILFGLDKAKMAIKNEKQAIFVEGQMDAITAHQEGYKNVIATSGTALTREQINLIKRYSDNIALAFDSDNAGQLAVDRGAGEAMRAEMNIKVIEVPSGKDPDECIRSNKSLWEKAVKEARPLMEYYFDIIFKDIDLNEVKNKRECAKKALEIISKLSNSIEKDYWLKRLAEKLNIKENILREALGGVKQRSGTEYNEKINIVKEEKEMVSREEMLSEILLALLVKFTSLINYSSDLLAIEQVRGQVNKLVYKDLIVYYNKFSDKQGEPFDYLNFKEWLKVNYKDSQNKTEDNTLEDQLKKIDKLVVLADRDYYDLEEGPGREELVKTIVDLKKSYLFTRKREVETLIVSSEKAGNDEEARNLMEELKNLSDEISELSDF
jgi:DNA primase